MSSPQREYKCLHSGYSHPLTRSWQSSPALLTPDHLMLPLFIVDEPQGLQPIGSMPGVARMGPERVVDYLAPLVHDRALKSVLLFSVTDMEKVQAWNCR